MKAPKPKLRGQSAVETVIVVPLFLFTILGLLQLSLMNQARLVAKYAAYKSVRAGTLAGGNPSKMDMAALAIVTPVVGGADTIGSVKKTLSGSDFTTAFTAYQNNKQDSIKIVETKICAPYKSSNITSNFDDPHANDPGSLEALDNHKLSGEVTLYYRLFIPFADMVIWYSSQAQTEYDKLRNEMTFLRLGFNKGKGTGSFADGNGDAAGGYGKKIGTVKAEDYKSLAASKKYFVPIRASYSLRMNTNWEDGVLTGKNDCAINWPKK